LVNLVSNGIKFTPTGGMVSVRSMTDAKGGISIIVRDTGIGIDPARIDNVLLSFEQEDKDLSRRYQGNGLGLSLTKALVEDHGG
jgi:signal transduction histidine kinase